MIENDAFKSECTHLQKKLGQSCILKQILSLAKAKKLSDLSQPAERLLHCSQMSTIK